MTNDEYIAAKKRAKFNLIWNSLICGLPKSSAVPLEKNGCAFNSQLVNHKDYYIICRYANTKNSGKIYFNRIDLEQIFLDYKSYLTEIREYRIRAKERVYNGFEVLQSDIDKLKTAVLKEFRRLRSENRYAKTLIQLGGGSIKTEIEIDKLSLYTIRDYVKKNRAKRKFGCIYFEFKEYGIEKISQLIWRNYKVKDILIEQNVCRFVEFCKEQKIIDIYDLILIPYYSKSLVSEFGAECLQAVINSIKTFIVLQTFEYTNISFDDLE